MEWTKEAAKNATNTALKPVRDPNGTYDAAANTANQAYDTASDYVPESANQAYDTAKDYVPSTGKAGEKASDATGVTGASILNTPPFSSFKPDPSTVWKGFLIYVLLAAGCTLPWWAFVTAADYFLFLYPGLHIIRYFTLAYYAPWLIVYILVSSFWREGTSWVKITLGLSVAIAALVTISVLAGVFKGGQGTTATFWVTLGAVAVAGCGDAIAQGSLLGISSELPEGFTKAYSCGAVVSGLFVFIVRVITKASMSSSATGLRISAIVYFSVSAFFLVLVLALFAYVHYMPEMSYYNSLNLGSFETTRLLIQDESSVTVEVAAGAAIAAVAAGRSAPAQPLTWTPVLTRVKLLAIATAITSIVSLSIFPGYLTEDVSSSELGSWYPLLLVGTYIVFDLLGRLLTVNSIPEKHSTVFGTAFARLFLIALFLLALFLGPSFLSTVLVIFLLTAILGFSNGYLVSTLTVLVPRCNPANEAETAGIYNTLIMNVAVLIGSGLSWIWIVAS